MMTKIVVKKIFQYHSYYSMRVIDEASSFLTFAGLKVKTAYKESQSQVGVKNKHYIASSNFWLWAADSHS